MHLCDLQIWHHLLCMALIICLFMSVLYTPPRVLVESARTPRTHSDSVRTPHRLCGLLMILGVHTKITLRELNQAPRTNSHLQGGVLYHCAIVACYTLPTCAIYVTCGLIGKCVYFYSI